MADIKISQLVELGAADLRDSDVLIINDVSTTTTKQITFGNLLSAYTENVVDSALGAKCTGDFVVDNELIIGGDITTTATFYGNRIDANQILNSDGNNLLVKSNLKLEDDIKLRFGDNNDLEIFHTPDNIGTAMSVIEDKNAGRMVIATNGPGIYIRDNDSNEIASFITSSGKARLHFVDTTAQTSEVKLITDAKGINITGKIDMTADVDGNGEMFTYQDSNGTTQGVMAMAQSNLAGVGNTTSIVMGFGGSALAFKFDSDAVTPALAYGAGFSTLSGADGNTDLGSTFVRWRNINMKEHLNIFNGTAPTNSIVDGVILYAEDVASSSELKVRDEAGNVTTLSPHNFELIPQGPSEDMAWSYYSEKDGKRINVDMLKAIRVLERLSGEQLVFED